MLTLIWSIGNVCREWGKKWLGASQFEPSSPNKYCDTNHVSLLLCVCLFGFVSGNWFICVVSWIKGTAKESWQLILKTSVQTYLSRLFLWNSSWFIPPSPRLEKSSCFLGVNTGCPQSWESNSACVDELACEHNLLKNVFSINNRGYFLLFNKNSWNALGNWSNSVALNFINHRSI